MLNHNAIRNITLSVLGALVLPFVPGIILGAIDSVFGNHVESADSLGMQIWAVTKLQLSQYFSRGIINSVWGFAAALFAITLASKGIPYIYRMPTKLILLRKIGARGFIPRNSNDAKKRSWDDCAIFLEETGNSSIFIMGANGWDTFGEKNSPLNKVLEEFRGSIRVLIMHPSSQGVQARAMSTKTTPGKYKANIVNSVLFCKSLHDCGRDISIRLFRWPPVWKLIFSDDRLWLQYYEEQKHIDDTHVYSFNRSPEDSSLYRPFMTEFKRSWDDSLEVDLNRTRTDIRKYLR